MPQRSPRPATLDPDEIARFSALAATWWDAAGPMRPLHRLNPTRLAWLKRQVCRRFDRAEKDAAALAGLTVLDIGCGAGILSEPLARMGAAVTGIDPSDEIIAAAKLHAAGARPRHRLPRHHRRGPRRGGSRNSTSSPSSRWSSTCPM